MKRKNPVTLATALAAGLAAAPACADNPFSAQPLSGGYMVAAADKMPQGKCGEGLCGAAMGMTKETPKDSVKAKPKAKVKEAKCGEGKCGEGKCGTKPKVDEGKCGASK